MRLLYATSIVYPSGLANRLQTFAMAAAFSKKLGQENFFLGAQKTNIKIPGVRIIDFNSGRSVKLGWLCMKFAKVEGITHVHSREAKLLFAMIFYNKFFFRKNIKFIYEVHTVYDRNFKDRFAEKFVSRNSYCVTYLTNFLKKDHTKRFSYTPKKSIVSPDGVDLSVFDISVSKDQSRKLLNIPVDKKVLVYTGRFKTMEMEKGLEDIFKALSILPPEIVFVAMGGKPRHMDYYRKLSEDMGLKERVFFIEHLNQDMVAVCQKAADILLMPYPDMLHYRYYMSPLKMFEYMASKRPIIATDLPSVREVLNENNSVLVPPGSPEAISKAIKLLLSDEKFSSEIAERAFIDVGNYTWDKRAERILLGAVN